MILTPEQIESFWNTRWCHGSIEQAMADTILAYAEVVEKIAEREPTTLMQDYKTGDWGWFCSYCGGVDGHTSDCPHLAARKLRGLDGT